MMNSRLTLLALVVGVLTAGPVSAATITVYAKMGGVQSSPAAVGQVVSAPAAISCKTNGPTGCVNSAATAGAYVLTASSAVNATFVSWAGCASVSGATCNLTAVDGKNSIVTANFAPTNYTLNVKAYPVTAASYGGSLTGTDITCASGPTPGDCTVSVPRGVSVVLTATPNAASRVASWSGCPTAPVGETCTAPMTAPRFVTVTFAAKNVPVTAAIQGAGTIDVPVSANVPDGMACSSADHADCTAGVLSGQSITLTSTAAPGAKLVGWTGCTSTTATGCTISGVTTAKHVTATFKPTTCAGCHSVPPATHVALAYGTECGRCHAGFTSDTVEAMEHMNGSTRVKQPRVAPPEGFGTNFNVVAAGLDDGSGKPYVDIRVANGADVAMDVIAQFGEFASGGAPRYSIGQTLPNGSFLPVLRDASSGAVVTSETSAATRYVDRGNGVFRYTFTADVAANLETTASYRAVVYGARYFIASGQANLAFPSSDFLDFSPAGAVVAQKATVSDAACNACHGNLNIHGRRRGVAVCLTCHNPNTPLGTGNTLPFKWDLKTVVHKAHAGMNFDGLHPFTGAQGTPWGTVFDASQFKMAPSHSTYFEGAGTATASTADDDVHALPLHTDCTICHTGPDADLYKVASRAACTTCHEINWVNFAGHRDGVYPDVPGTLGPFTDDAVCAYCHPADGPAVAPWVTPVSTVHSGLREPNTGADFARPVVFNGTTFAAVPASGKHVVDVSVTGFSVHATTGRPTILFTITRDGAPFVTFKEALTSAGTALDSTDDLGGRIPTCAFILAGPNSDYVIPATGSANIGCGANGANVTAVNASAGQYQLAITSGAIDFNTLLPNGTHTLSYEMVYQRQAGSDSTGIVRKPFAANPKFYVVTKTDTAWTLGQPGSTGARRQIVAFEKCNACHVDLGFHSNRGRKGPDYCATCHNPKLDNGTRARVKVADAYKTDATGDTRMYLPESVSMNVFIHRIHMASGLPSLKAAALASPYVPEPGKLVYGATRSMFVGVTATTRAENADFSKFAMPNPMGRCDQCHTSIESNLETFWASTGLAPVERTYKVCVPTTVPWDTEPWCDTTVPAGTAAMQMPTTNGTTVTTAITVVTPPVKAVCTSCHDDLATDAHADAMTTAPMTPGAAERCVDCHSEGTTWDAAKYHPQLP